MIRTGARVRRFPFSRRQRGRRVGRSSTAIPRNWTSSPSANGRRPTRIVIVTAEVGEGHAAAARALAADLAQSGATVEVVVCDALAGLGSPLRYLLLDAYRWQLRVAPWIFGGLYRLFTRVAAARALGRAGLIVFGAGSLLRLVESHDPDLVVSTYPAATNVLGHLRRSGRFTKPVYATITDLAGLTFWSHPGIDLHFVMHDSCVSEVERVAGQGSVCQVRPLVAQEFFLPRESADARRALDLPQTDPLVVVSGGGWGVGDLADAVCAGLAIEHATVVCLAGRSERTHERLRVLFAQERRVVVWRFIDQMSELLAAADVLVHSTGGVTCLEALARDCPIIAYGAPPGHAPLAARTMAAIGLAEAPDSEQELVQALRRALEQGKNGPRLRPLPAAAEVLLSTTSPDRISGPRAHFGERVRVERVSASTAYLR
jgi:processive 1,2-diacylglycerol beta-glucosyltransferase